MESTFDCIPGADARHLHEGRVLAHAEEGAGQREESEGAHDPLRHAAQGERETDPPTPRRANLSVSVYIQIEARLREPARLFSSVIKRIFPHSLTQVADWLMDKGHQDDDDNGSGGGGDGLGTMSAQCCRDDAVHNR